MTDQDELKFPRRQRSAMLSDEVWAALRRRAVVEHRSASVICEKVLAHYLSLDEKPEKPSTLEDLETRKRSVHVTDPIWSDARAQAVMERRSVSEMLEHLLRAYLGLEIHSVEARSARRGEA